MTPYYVTQNPEAEVTKALLSLVWINRQEGQQMGGCTDRSSCREWLSSAWPTVTAPLAPSLLYSTLPAPCPLASLGDSTAQAPRPPSP